MPTDVSIYGQIRQPESFANQLLALTAADRQQAALSADQLALGQRHLDAVHQALAAQAANPNATVDDLHRGLGDLAAQGMITAGDAQRYGGQIEALRGNPAAMRNFLNGHLNALQDARTNFGATYGTPVETDTGDNLLLRSVSPTMGARTIAQVPKTLTPAEKGARQTVYQNGQAGTAPTSATTDRYGYPLRAAPIAGAQGGSGSAAGAVSMAPAGFTPTGPALGQTRVAEEGAGQFTGDLRSAAGAGAEVANLSKALAALDALGDTGTGPGTATRNRIQSALSAAGLSGLPGIDKAKIGSFEEAAAFLDAARRQGAITPGTGQAPGSGTTTAPTGALDISQPAARALVQAQIAQRRMQAAQALSYDDKDNGAGYGRHAADFANRIDPRAFVVDKMNPTEKQALMRSLGAPGSPAYERFRKSLQAAHDQGQTSVGN
jgi:hypothetical protein